MVAATLADLRRGALSGIRELRLGGCGLTEFPREILGLAGTLEVLDLGFNALTSLPHDFGRLSRLRVFFASGNRFGRLPPVLGDCAGLTQIGFRGAGLREVPGEALPPQLRWLTLTDNAIEALPAELGLRPRLQKLMLSGNALRALPPGLAEAPRLELLRIAANRFEVLPPWLAEHASLAWVAWAGNGVDPCDPPAAQGIPWRELELGPLLGQGASGLVHRALWHAADAAPRPVAVKLFKGAMTSDGLPGQEMAACLSAGGHPHLLGAMGRVGDHPEGLEALVMPLLPEDWRALAAPPSLESCTRDVFAPGLRLEAPVALRLVRGIAGAVAHLHGRGLLHGDLYAHNILWDGAAGEARLSDFGAACRMPSPELRRIEVRAFGILLGEVLDHVDAAARPAILRDIQARCMQPRPSARPDMAEIERLLA